MLVLCCTVTICCNNMCFIEQESEDETEYEIDDDVTATESNGGAPGGLRRSRSEELRDWLEREAANEIKRLELEAFQVRRRFPHSLQRGVVYCCKIALSSVLPVMQVKKSVRYNAIVMLCSAPVAARMIEHLVYALQ
jgi:hypothetical protein